MPRMDCFALALVLAQAVEPSALVRADDPRIASMGRLDRRDPARPRLGFPGIVIRAAFEGPSLSMRADDTGRSSFDVVVDGGEPRIVRLEKGEREYVIADGLGDGPHVVELTRRTETWQGITTFVGLRPAVGGRLLEPPPWPRRKLLFVGDSVTAGEWAGRSGACVRDSPLFADARLSYAMVLGRTLDAQVELVAMGGRGLTRDWQGRTDLLTAPRFLELALPEDDSRAPARDEPSAFVPDAIVVSLGTNDFNLALGALPEREAFVGTYVELVKTLRRRYPAAHVFLTDGPLVDDDADPVRKARTTLRGDIADTIGRAADPAVHAVFSRRYAGDACDAHPTAEQHRAIARELEPILRAALGW